MMMKPAQKRSWWSMAILDGQHTVFRIVSVAFSAVSAWAIYWVFVTLGDQLIAVVTSVAFVALGYYVTRGLAHRLMTKGRRSVWSFVWIMLIYAFVEVSCNFAHAAAGYADVAWMAGLHGWLHTFFSYDLLVVLSIIPLFNIALAQIDVGLMQEKGQISAMVPAQPKAAPAFKGMGTAMGAVQPQAGYGGNTAAQGGGPKNALKQWWGNRSAQAGQPVMPSPAAMSAMASYPSAPVMPGATNGGGMNGMNGIP